MDQHDGDRDHGQSGLILAESRAQHVAYKECEQEVDPSDGDRAEET